MTEPQDQRRAAPRRGLRAPQRGRTRVGGLALALGLIAQASLGQDQSCGSVGDYPCGYQLREQTLDRVPQRIAFEARVTQLEAPVADASFTAITVNVIKGSQVLCSEQFKDVLVKNGVVSLIIGENLNCSLDELTARHADLGLQLCLGGQENCSKAIPFAATPYAIKTSVANAAQHAHRANRAAQAHYTHRMSADADLGDGQSVRTGYWDFHTPNPGNQGLVYSDADYGAHADSGFLAWSPTRDRAATAIHVIGRDSSGELAPLDHLYLRSGESEMTGSLVIARQARVATGGVVVEAGGLQAVGNSAFTGSLEGTGSLTVDSGGLYVVSGGADITGGVTVRNGSLGVDRDTTLHSGLQGAGAAALGGRMAVAGASSVSGSLSVEGETTLGGGILGETAITGGGLIVDGAAVFHGPVTFHAGIQVTGQPGPLPSTSGTSGGAEVLYVNRDAGSDRTGAYDVLLLGAKRGVTLSGGTGPVTLGTGALFNEATAVGGDLSVAGSLAVGGLNVGGAPVALAHDHPYAESAHDHAATYSDLSHSHPYAPSGHGHGSFAALGHGHGEFSSASHGHGSYASSGHGHGELAGTSHGHGELSSSGHSHGYSTSDHGHSDYADASHTHAAAPVAVPVPGACSNVAGPAAVGAGGDGDDPQEANYWLKALAGKCPSDKPIMKGWSIRRTGSGDKDLYLDMQCCAVK